jgi:hypothetical protein
MKDEICPTQHPRGRQVSGHGFSQAEMQLSELTALAPENKKAASKSGSYELFFRRLWKRPAALESYLPACRRHVLHFSFNLLLYAIYSLMTRKLVLRYGVCRHLIADRRSAGRAIAKPAMARLWSYKSRPCHKGPFQNFSPRSNPVREIVFNSGSYRDTMPDNNTQNATCPTTSTFMTKKRC